MRTTAGNPRRTSRTVLTWSFSTTATICLLLEILILQWDQILIKTRMEKMNRVLLIPVGNPVSSPNLLEDIRELEIPPQSAPVPTCTFQRLATNVFHQHTTSGFVKTPSPLPPHVKEQIRAISNQHFHGMINHAPTDIYVTAFSK